MKKREGTRGKRGGPISRGSERERPRGWKREDEREGARRRARRRERDGRICVLKQTFDQSADCCQSYVAAAYPSVPVAGPRIQFRVFTRRGNQGPSARAAIRENRALNVSRAVVDDRAARLELNPRPSSRSLKGRNREIAVEGCSGRRTAGLFVERCYSRIDGMGAVRCVAAYVRVLSAENVGAAGGIR